MSATRISLNLSSDEILDAQTIRGVHLIIEPFDLESLFASKADFFVSSTKSIDGLV
tara:strand:- start:546 stop:713 length:168 start_codon:yes stop_codon:yes gene_type:complete